MSDHESTDGNGYLFAHEVFNTIGLPKRSYVSRPTYETLILDELKHNFPSIIEVSGPSKTGKTILVLKCLEVAGRQSIKIFGNHIKNIEDFWTKLGQELRIDESVSSSMEGGITTPIGSYTTKKESTSNPSLSETEIASRLINKSVVLIVEDFHQIPNNAREDVIRAVKSLTERTINTNQGLKVILSLVRTKDIYNSHIWSELQGRITPVTLHLWSPTELNKIATQPTNRAGAGVLDISNISDECFGLPYIMQLGCLHYWLKAEKGVVIPGRGVRIAKAIAQEVFKDIAASLWIRGFDDRYQELVFNDNIIMKDLIRKKDNKKGNINQMILYSIASLEYPNAHQGFKIEQSVSIGLDRVFEKTRKLVDFKSSEKLTLEIIEKALIQMHTYINEKYMNEISKTNNPLDPILEYNTKTKKVIFYDPAFLVALRFSQDHEEYFISE